MALPAQHSLGSLPTKTGIYSRRYARFDDLLSLISPRSLRLFATSCLLFVGAHRAIAHPVLPTAPRAPLTQTGLASWYGGKKFSGKRTANGEKFQPTELTAAHRTLPLGTRILVHSPQTGRSVIVRVNDRGPFAKNRILDLSKEAASRLHIIQRGISRVTLTVLPQQTIPISQPHTRRPTRHG